MFPVNLDIIVIVPHPTVSYSIHFSLPAAEHSPRMESRCTTMRQMKNVLLECASCCNCPYIPELITANLVTLGLS